MEAETVTEGGGLMGKEKGVSMDLSAGVFLPEEQLGDSVTAGGAARFALGGVIEDIGNNGNNICQKPPRCFITPADDGRSGGLQQITNFAVDDASALYERSDNGQSANDGQCSDTLAVNDDVLCQDVCEDECSDLEDKRKPSADNTGPPDVYYDLKEDEHKLIADNTGPPFVKSGFKGKRANKKFGIYGKRGGDRKINGVPRTVPTNNHLEPHEYQPRRSTSAGQKVTKSQIIHKLITVTRQYRQAQMEKEIALSANHSLTKKVTKSKQVVDELRTCLTDARQEVRSTKSHYFKAQQEITATKNALLSSEKEHSNKFAAMVTVTEETFERVTRGHKILTAKVISKSEKKLVATERKHKREVNTITKLEREKLTAKDDLHELDLEKKNNEISAIINMNDKRKRQDSKLHKKLVVSKVKKYSRLLAAKDAKHDKMVSVLRQTFTDELHKSDAKIEAAAEKYKKLKRDHNAVLDDIKIKHRSSFRKQQILHARLIERKNETVKKMLQDVEDTREMLWETLNEMNESKRTVALASSSAKKTAALAERATGRSSMLYKKLEESSSLINELKDEINDENNVISDLRSKVDEYDVIIDCMEWEYEAKCNEHRTEISTIKAYYEEIIRKQSPRHVMKHWVKNKESRGGHCEWLPHVDKLIIEMLANRTPPTCIQANIFAMSRVLYSDIGIVRELPSLKHIKNLRTVLSIVTKTLAAYRLGCARNWRQLHTDETSRRQVSIVNVVISIIDNDNELRTICMSGSIISKDGTADEQSRAIISAFNDSGRLLQEWRDMTSDMYPGHDELLVAIPNSDDMSPAKLIGGFLSHDNCATANKTGNNLMEKILQLGKEAGMSGQDLILYQGHCFHHLRNTWFEAIEKYLSRKLTDDLRHDLESIPSHLRVSCKISDLLRQVDKEYSFTANYFKGSGNEYADWKERFRPGKRYLPPIRVLGGNRQDAAFEGALPVYDGRADMLIFTNECLLASDNLLQRSLFIVLGSMEMIAQLRVASILHLGVVLPMRWLAGNTHKLAKFGWGERSMGRAITLLHDAFVEIQSDGSLLLEQDFIMNIFSPLYEEIPPLKKYLDYHFEEKEGNVIGSIKEHGRVLAIDEAMAELFYPQKMENRQTTEFCHELSVGVATTLLIELTDPKKSTHNYIDDGILAFNNLSLAEKEASLGMRANNDPSEGNFATFTDVLCNSGRISIDSAAGIGQARYNKDLDRDHICFITRGKGSGTITDESAKTGAFHTLPVKLQDSLLAVAKKNGKRSRRQFTASLRRQREARAAKAANALAMKLQSTEKDLINISYLHQKYFSPRCWKSVGQALDEFERLTSKKEKIECVKEQILIRYLGLGWEEAHHPWSKNKHTYTASELLKHLCEVVIPLQDTKKVPDQPPIKLPARPDSFTLGTKSADLIQLDDGALAREERIRLNAMLERDRREDSGFGDQLMEMQQTSWAIDKIRIGSFKIDMCFSYGDDDGEILQWCQGTVMRILKEEKTFIIVQIKWDKKCLREGDKETTSDKLMKSKWNSNEHQEGTWREDLHHMAKTAEYL